jgi:hypothetical protein
MRQSAGAGYMTAFRSYANGLADISLQLDENHIFHFTLTIMPEWDSDDTLPETFTFKGQWNADNAMYFMKFGQDDEIDLHALVDPAYAPDTNVFVIDERTLAFPVEAREVIIWGITCYRSPV